MTQSYDADVIIAGAGMAGATTGLALASAGLTAILVDPAPFEDQLAPTFDGRSSAIAYSSFRQWRVLGLGEALEPHAQRIEQILVTDGAAPGAASGRPGTAFLRFDSAEIGDTSDGEPLGYMLENRRIRAALAKAVKANPALTVLAPVSVTGLEVTPGSACVTLSDGRVLTAPLVIGAEGRGSIVREAAGIGVVGWGYGQSGVVVTVALEEDHQGVAHEYFLPGGPFAILPLTDQRASLVWTERTAQAEALRGARPEIIHAHMQRRFGDFLGRPAIQGPVFVYPLSLSLAERMSALRIALLGDAAHGVHPIAGQGLNLGLKDAAALAQVLLEAARNGEDIGSETVLERYGAWRRFDNVMLAAATDVFTRLFSNDLAPVRFLRGAGLAVVNTLAPARKFFMREAGGAIGDLPRLLRGEPL